MYIEDKNKSWEAPAGYDPLSVMAEGSYLVVIYRRETPRGNLEYWTIYLNDQGREVLHMVEQITQPQPTVADQTPQSLLGRIFEMLGKFFERMAQGA